MFSHGYMGVSLSTFIQIFSALSLGLGWDIIHDPYVKCGQLHVRSLLESMCKDPSLCVRNVIALSLQLHISGEEFLYCG